MILKKLFSTVIIASVFASCSMVKSPQSANFNRVKYNSHLKLAKNETKEKLPETVTSFEEETEIRSKKAKKMEHMQAKRYATPLLASTNLLIPKKAKPINQNANQVEIVPNKKENQSLGLFGEATDLMHPKSVREYLNKPLSTSAAVEDPALGNLLYIILVVILVLIVLGLIADLAGGLVGTLIAVLLILLLLRLLGIV